MSELNVVKVWSFKEVGDRKVEVKVKWMEGFGYVSVNGEEYRLFRKWSGGKTHVEYVVSEMGKVVKKGEKREKIVERIMNRWVKKVWKEGEIEIQVGQYVSQLSEKGWNGLINKIVKVVDGK